MKRLPAASRKQAILDGARRAFSKNGDVRATTTKEIAEEAGISEAIIYRHFASKQDLFIQCAVDPLTEAINRHLERFARFEFDISGRDLHELGVQYWTDLIDTLTELVPLLGLVLFGDPETSTRFYREVLTPALDRVSESWSDVYRKVSGVEYPFPHATKAHFGIGLMFALDRRLAEHPPTTHSIATAVNELEAQGLGSALLKALSRQHAEPDLSDS